MSNTNILVIEDDPLTLYSLLDLLEAENFQVTGAPDGDIALKMVATTKFDVIICDLLLPHLNGYEVLSFLRKNVDTANIPFIVLTGKGKREDIRLGMELGVNDYIIKPFINQELIKSIQIQLEKKRFLERCYQSPANQLADSLEQKSLQSLAEHKSKYPLYHDDQINLSNQLSLRDRFDKMVSKYVQDRLNFNSSSTKQNSNIAVCCLNLDHQPGFSTSLDQQQNYAIIRIAAQRLAASIGNKAKIARLHGRNFAIILPYVKQFNQAIELIKIAQSDLFKPFLVADKIIHLTPYVGISFYPSHSKDIKTLLERAKQALKQAKQNYEDCYEIYHPDLESSQKFKSLTLADDLHHAWLNNELEVNYQPQVELCSGKVKGFEALLRWYHPQRGSILPQTFIPIAEDIGLMESIEQWFLDTVIKQIQYWHQNGYTQLKSAINLSESQFHHPNFISNLTSVLSRARIAPQSLTVELTEDILLKDKQNSIKTISELKSLGIDIALDNFSTGYSSLGYLEQFPFTILKVDLAHLNSMVGSFDSQMALQYIMQVAQRLQVKIIIEKLENRSQLNFLRQHKFETAQGYFLSVPMKAEKFDLLLQNKINWLSILFSFPPI